MFSSIELTSYFTAIIIVGIVPLASWPVSQQDSANEFKWTRAANANTNTNDDDVPASKCQDIYEKDRNSLSGYYNINIDGQVIKVYCYFHNPQRTVIRQLYDLDGRPQEWNVHIPAHIDDGDPEGAMEMQIQPEDIPEGADTHFMQPIIDHQETMYYNKTLTVQNLIEMNNRRERERKKQLQLQNQNQTQ